MVTQIMATKLCLFFFYGTSLKNWVEDGIFDRETLLYKRLVEKGIDVTFFTYGDKSDFEYQSSLKGINILPAYTLVKKPKNKLIAFLQAFLLPFYFRKHFSEFDLFKTDQTWGVWIPLIAKLLCDKPLLVRCGFEVYKFSLKKRDNFIRRIFTYTIARLGYYFADRIHVASQSDVAFIREHFHITLSKIYVVPNYIETNLFRPMNLSSKNGSGQILFIGRLADQKNLSNLLKAIKGTSYKLDIIGDGELKSVLAEYAAKNNLNVRFLGKFPNKQLPEIINNYNIFILPSFFEGHPKSLLEAMSCGLPVIGTNVEGIREVLSHKENGYLCDTDANSIRMAIQTVMEDKTLQEKIGKHARLYISDKCSLENILEKEMFAYNKLVPVPS